MRRSVTSFALRVQNCCKRTSRNTRSSLHRASNRYAATPQPIRHSLPIQWSQSSLSRIIRPKQAPPLGSTQTGSDVPNAGAVPSGGVTISLSKSIAPGALGQFFDCLAAVLASLDNGKRTLKETLHLLSVGRGKCDRRAAAHRVGV